MTRDEMSVVAFVSVALATFVLPCSYLFAPPPGGGGGPVAATCVVVIQRTCAGEFGDPPDEELRCPDIECIDSCEGEKGFNFIASRDDYDDPTKKWDTTRPPVAPEQGTWRILEDAGGVRCAYIWNCKPECEMVPGVGKRCQSQTSEITLAFKVIGESQGICDLNP